MRPMRLLLDGFGTYRNETEIDFDGVDFFALVGPTGSGKSTVIDALCFALYGTVPRWDNEKEVRNALAPSANACRVSLIFELSGQRYVAVRTLQRDKNGKVSTKAARLERLDDTIPASAPLAELLQASAEQLAEGPDNVKSRVQDLLGLSYEHFTQSVLLPQGGFAEFLRATPANRQRLLSELLAFGVYKEIGQRARERAQLAQARLTLAGQAREQLAGATQQAESAAAARLADLTDLAARVDTSLTMLTDQQAQVTVARLQVQQERNAVGQLAEVRPPAAVEGLAQQIAAAQSLVADRRQHLDNASLAAEAAARSRADLPDKASVQRHLDNHALRRDLIAEASRQAKAVAAAHEQEAKLAGRLQAAELDSSLAQEALDAAQRAHAAAGLAQTLHAGDSCPVCQQRVAALPQHEAPADLASARATLDATAAAQRAARAAHQDAGKTAAAAVSALQVTQARLEKAAAVMADAPAEAVLTGQLTDIAAADEALRRAGLDVTARQHELAAAEKSRAALASDEERAWAALAAGRDKLVPLGVPAIAAGAGRDLAAAWSELTGWAAAEATRRERALPEQEAAVAALQQQFDAGAIALAGLLAEHEVQASGLEKAPAAVAEQRVRTETRLKQIRDDRKKAAQLDRQITADKQETQVAELLGNLLRANRFENWLCSEALGTLVSEASTTLMELSGGQYELALDSRNDLAVIDYNDAGSTRPVHTLSGGETFQASLALALALSRQVIGLSGGRRELNSMFLDEGFGTLDGDTLETVASTLERLAADSDRMVGVITHVAELAERVPVRFVVSRSGTTSAIVREGP
jgi:exonuclease SbcC